MLQKVRILTVAGLLAASTCLLSAQQTSPNLPLAELQQAFVDLRFGMFIHFNIPTFMEEDWADPDASPAIFNPTKLDCRQWARAAKAANMSYGCLTTKHHSGFCIWDTKTTDYGVMSSPLKRDVVKEYADAFRAEGLKVMFYYSILDTHHRLRPHHITAKHAEMVKAQLTELLTRYGEINALIIDGWDAPWSRISYDEIPFEDIYHLVKSLQPNCLLMDLNSAKYPGEGMFYTDIKSYEQNAGQHIKKDANRLPALSCMPIQKTWFWKERFPNIPVKDAKTMVDNNIVPLNKAYCNFILNVAPNRYGLIDDNAVAALKEIGRLWKNEGPMPKLTPAPKPIISSNIAKNKPSESSWSNDMDIMDFANDDDFQTEWVSNKTVKHPWWEVSLSRSAVPFNMISVVDNGLRITKYHFEYLQDGVWKTIAVTPQEGRVKVHRFDRVWGDKLRVYIDGFTDTPSIAEVGVYNER